MLRAIAFDRLNVQVAHSPTGKDVVSAISYDNQGRLSKQYEPIESPNSTGQFYTVPTNSPHTLVTYEASPLNREQSMTPPNWYTTTTEYGTNAEDELIDYDINETFNQATLQKTTTTDPNGNKTETFTDLPLYSSSIYIHEVEREADSHKFFQRVGGVRTIKPRCTLIYGRSGDWTTEQQEAFRILNSSYHNLTIMTFDHVIERAKRILGQNC